MIRAFDLRSPPYPAGARDYVVAPFPAVLRALRPLERSLIIDVPTAAAFAIERIDELSTAALYEATGRDAMPDGTPAKGLRIALRRRTDGEAAHLPAAFRGQMICELDTGTMESDLGKICVDGFAEARKEAEDRRRAPVSLSAAAEYERMLSPDAKPDASPATTSAVANGAPLHHVEAPPPVGAPSRPPPS